MGFIGTIGLSLYIFIWSVTTSAGGSFYLDWVAAISSLLGGG